MDKSSELIVSKLDAAKRQLDTAIRLYFHYEDPVSIHTLASAAYTLLADLAKGSSVEVPHFRQMMIDSVPDDLKKVYRFHARKHQNFFKHADKDHDANIPFNPHATDWVLIDSVMIYRKLTTENPPLCQLFDIWFQYHNRHLLREEFQHQKAKLETFSQHFQDRKRFFAELLPVVSGVAS